MRATTDTLLSAWIRFSFILWLLLVVFLRWPALHCRRQSPLSSSHYAEILPRLGRYSFVIAFVRSCSPPSCCYCCCLDVKDRKKNPAIQDSELWSCRRSVSIDEPVYVIWLKVWRGPAKAMTKSRPIRHKPDHSVKKEKLAIEETRMLTKVSLLSTFSLNFTP